MGPAGGRHSGDAVHGTGDQGRHPRYRFRSRDHPDFRGRVITSRSFSGVPVQVSSAWYRTAWAPLAARRCLGEWRPPLWGRLRRANLRRQACSTTAFPGPAPQPATAIAGIEWVVDQRVPRRLVVLWGFRSIKRSLRMKRRSAALLQAGSLASEASSTSPAQASGVLVLRRHAMEGSTAPGRRRCTWPDWRRHGPKRAAIVERLCGTASWVSARPLTLLGRRGLWSGAVLHGKPDLVGRSPKAQNTGGVCPWARNPHRSS